MTVLPVRGWRGDQRALAHALRRDDVDDAAGLVLDGGIVQLHLEPAGRIERRQIVEMDLVLDLLGVFEIDGGDLQEREIALAVLGRADRAFHRVAGAQAEAADLRRGDVDIVGSRQIIGFRRAQEAEAVLQGLDHALADDFDIALREFLQDREHHVLLAHGRGILDLELLGERQQIGGFLVFEILQLHRLQAFLNGHENT